jgi:hypothetical protein
MHYPPATTWKVDGKSQSRSLAKSVFLLPLDPGTVEQDEIVGTLLAADIHDREYQINFSAKLIRNEPFRREV